MMASSESFSEVHLSILLDMVSIYDRMVSCRNYDFYDYYPLGTVGYLLSKD